MNVRSSPSVPPEQAFASAAYIAEVARERQLAQLQEIDGLDQKAASMIGFAGVILALLFSSSFTSEHWSLGLSVGGAVLAMAVLPLGYALVPRGYKFNPNPAALDELFLREPLQRTQIAVVKSVRRAIEFNATRVELKSRAIVIGTVMIVLAVCVIAASLLYAQS